MCQFSAGVFFFLNHLYLHIHWRGYKEKPWRLVIILASCVACACGPCGWGGVFGMCEWCVCIQNRTSEKEGMFAVV